MGADPIDSSDHGTSDYQLPDQPTGPFRSHSDLMVFLIILLILIQTPIIISLECIPPASAEESGQQPIIHTILVDGKDSGNIHVLPYQAVNISALISHAEKTNVSLMRGSSEILAPEPMHRSGNQFWLSIIIPESLSDLETYEVRVRCENRNGTDSLRAGRIIRPNHLRVDTVISPGAIHTSANISMTVRTWKDEPVASGRFSVSLVSYRDAETFTTLELGQYELSGSGPDAGSGSTTVSKELSFEDLTLLKFDVDAVDDQRNHLGRASSYALGVPFPVNISCDKPLLELQGFTLCGPYSPGSEIPVEVETQIDVSNATFLVYRIDQLQDLVLEGDEPLSEIVVELVNGSAKEEIPAPGSPGSYLLAVRVEKNGTTSIGMFSFVVQNMTMTVDHDPSLNRTDVLGITVKPELIPEDGDNGVSVTIIGPSDLLLLSDENSDLIGDSYHLEYRLPVYAPNGTYNVIVTYGESGTFNSISVAISNFTIAGGPTAPQAAITDPPAPRDSDEQFPFFLVGLIALLFGLIVYAALSFRNWKTSSDSLGLHEEDRGITEGTTKQTGHGDHPDPGGEQKQAEKETGGGEKIELGEGQGEKRQ
jgi:hypothetical protein